MYTYGPALSLHEVRPIAPASGVAAAGGTMPALARLAVYQVRSSATSPLTIARAGPARRMPKTSSRRRKLTARIATPSSPSPLHAAPADQPHYLLWRSYGEIQRRVGGIEGLFKAY